MNSINIIIALVKLIYDRKDKISNESIINFIKSINYALKNDKILNKDDIQFFIEKSKDIFLNVKNDLLNEDNYNEIKNCTQQEEEKESKTIKSNRPSMNYSSYSKQSQN